jgi:uncharacterized membrane protein YozB (DUF420 family)
MGPLPGLTLAVTRPAFGAYVSLVLVLASAVLFTIGWRLAVAHRFPAHCRVQTTAAALNAVVVVFWMIRSFALYIAPELPARLGDRVYAVTTVHAVIGVIGLVLGAAVVLRARELVPASLRFRNMKGFMRASYVLYLFGTATGVTVFVVAYGASFR